MADKTPRFFRNAEALRKWFEKNHDKQDELWIGFYKVHTGKPTVSYKEAVDQALCFGWIDGVRYSIDEDAYMNRFTPRRKGSTWSQVNIKRVQELRAAGLMTPAGERVFAERDVARTNQYSFERENVALPPEYERLFRKNRKAWEFFQSQPPSYRKPATWWVMSAKQEETRKRRLETLIKDSADGLRIASMRPRKKS